MSEENTNANAAVNAAEEKPAKKSWFNRVWSAFTGLVVGVAAMFGINRAQVNEIRAEVQTAYDKVKEVQVAVENKDWGTAISAATDAAAALKEAVGDVKDAADTAKDTFEGYVADFETLKATVEAKDWVAAKNAAVELVKKITANIPVEQLEGKTKDLYEALNSFIQSLDEGKYDNAINTVQKVASWLPKKNVATAPELPAETGN